MLLKATRLGQCFLGCFALRTRPPCYEEALPWGEDRRSSQQRTSTATPVAGEAAQRTLAPAATTSWPLSEDHPVERVDFQKRERQ